VAVVKNKIGVGARHDIAPPSGLRTSVRRARFLTPQGQTKSGWRDPSFRYMSPRKMIITTFVCASPQSSLKTQTFCPTPSPCQQYPQKAARLPMAGFRGVGDERLDTGAYVSKTGRHTGPTLLTGAPFTPPLTRGGPRACAPRSLAALCAYTREHPFHARAQ